MRPLKRSRNSEGKPCVEVPLRGHDLIRHPLLNKGTAFTDRERTDFHLHGLLPSGHNTLEQQTRRSSAAVARVSDPLEKYNYLVTLQNRNEQLFYSVLCENLESLMPIIYTPTVGRATQRFSHEFRGGRGLWITPEHRGKIRDMLRRGPYFDDIRLMVVTDNESILGIGDQGAGGMAISVGKLALYSAGAGIHPAQTLPVSLDIGTNNEELLNDDLYLGWREERLTGDAYFSLVEEFVEAVQEVFPAALIQWEDFRNANALSLLSEYRGKVLSFNDDIQGTGAVTLAGIMSALRSKDESLNDQRIVIHGAGAAGYGIALQLIDAMCQQGNNREDAIKQIAVLDSKGLLINERLDEGNYKHEISWSREYAASHNLDLNQPDLENVVAQFKPSILIGSSGSPGAFDEGIVGSMSAHCERPVILPFSNPTSLSEAAPADLLKWTDGKALVATGSPYDPVTLDDGRTVKIGQGNNVFIFPGLGLGAIVAEAAQVTDSMVSAAAFSLAEQVSEAELNSGSLYPSVTRLREVSRAVALAVAKQAREDGVTMDFGDQELETRLEEAVWEPGYPEYLPV